MHRLLWYTAGSYLVPHHLASAMLLGLSAADVAYTVQGGGWIALATASLVFKTTTGLVYVYRTFF
jgi:hypothetical protein